MVLTIGMTSFSGIGPALDVKVVPAGALVDAGGLGLVGTLWAGISGLVNFGTVCGGRSVNVVFELSRLLNLHMAIIFTHG